MCLFAASLCNLFQYYLASKNVGTNFDKLCDLIIAGRLKGSLPHGTLSYVLSLEGDDWFESDRVATLADIYVSNRADSSNTKTAPSSACVVSAATLVVGLVSRLEVVMLVRPTRVEVM